MEERVKSFIENPRRALFILAYPVIISGAVETAYGLVDTAFVGRLGSNAIAALTFSFPLFFSLFAIESIVDVGMQSRIARFLGMGDKTEAENTAMHGILMAVLLAFLILPVIFFLRPIFEIFGAEGDVLPLALDYMSIILPGAFLMFPAYVIGNIFISQGDSKTSMIIDISSLILNAILAPIFIYLLKLGVKGSALSTICALAFALGLGIYFLKTRSHLRLRFRIFRFSPQIFLDIVKVGIPASFTVAIISFYVIFINKFMSHFGTPYVATFGIASRLESVATLPVFGFGTAVLTLAGMFYGAKRYDLLKRVSYYGLKITVAFTALIGLIFFIIPGFFYRIFTPDAALIALGINYMRLDTLTFPLMAVNMIISRILQGIGKGVPGFVINIVRIFGVAIPLAYLFVYYLDYGYLSVAVAMVIGGIASSILGVIWIILTLRKLNR